MLLVASENTCKDGARSMEDSLNKFLDKLEDTTMKLPCNASGKMADIPVELKGLKVKEELTTCDPISPLRPIVCNITVEKTKLTIDKTYSMKTVRTSKFSVMLNFVFGATAKDGVKLVFKNITLAEPDYRRAIDFKWTPCQFYKLPIWSVFEPVYNGLVMAIVSSKMPESCTFKQ